MSAVVLRASRSLLAAGVVTAVLALVAAGPGVGLATHSNPLVHLSGHVDCGGLDSPQNITYRTDAGESGSADLEDWTSINRAASKIAGREIPGIDLVKIQTYNIWLNDVPKDGTHIYLDVTCGNNALGDTGGFSPDFGVRRPLVGTDATRHICNKGPFNPFPCLI